MGGGGVNLSSENLTESYSSSNLIILLAANNTGKTCVLSGIEKFANFSQNLSLQDSNKDCTIGVLSEKDKCNYYDVKELPELTLKHKIETALLDSIPVFDGFKGKTFGVVFTPDTLERCKKKEGFCGDEECLEFWRNKLNSELFVLHSTSQNTRKEEIRIISKDCNYMFLCSIDKPGECPESLMCFHAFNIDWNKGYESHALKFLGNFNLHSTFKKQIDCDDTNEFRKFLKNQFDKSRSNQTPTQKKTINTNTKKAYSFISAKIFLDETGKTQYLVTRKDCNSKDEKVLKDTDIKAYEKNLGLRIIPKNIIFYKEKEFDDTDLSIKPQDLKQSVLFSIVFQSCEQNVEDILKAYEDKNEQKKKSIAKGINEKLKGNLAKKFNELFLPETTDLVYTFELDFKETKIVLSLCKHNEVISIKDQSAGFKKFFNFYFNFLYNIELCPGDIILIDEAETHLDSVSQREFAQFLQDFGRKHKVFFIVTTHSPYMIDLANLCSLRFLIPNKEDKKFIEFQNDFSILHHRNEQNTKANTLALIKKTLGGFAMLEGTVIFVEGISDYNFLNAFNSIHEYKDGQDKLIFLPIDGLCKYDDNKEGLSKEQEEKVENILSFAKELRQSPIFSLVDGDETGTRFQKSIKNHPEFKEKIHVFSLNDIKGLTYSNPKNKVIEELFSKEDEEKLHILSSKEEGTLSPISSVVKHALLQNKDFLSLTAKGNFKKIIEFLHEKTRSSFVK